MRRAGAAKPVGQLPDRLLRAAAGGEGDFVLYGERYYEIMKLSSSRKLFGQVNNTFETSAICKRARKGLFDAT